MRVMPRSLAGRLLVTAGIALTCALGFAAFTIAHVLERFVLHGLDERLDAQIMVVARGVEPDGRLDPARIVDVPPFDRARSGWAWQVRAPGGTLRSASLGGADIAMPLGPPRRPWRERGEGLRATPFEARDSRGDAVHGRMAVIRTAGGEVRILATGPRRIVDRPLRAAMVPLAGSLLLLGLGLAAAIVVQLRVGLRPLATLRAMLSEVREGRRDQIEASEPTELLPLIGELNAMIGANRTALAQARGHVANLAHGLKTPLAALRLDLGPEADVRLLEHVERIDRHVRHHLGRARAASPSGAGQAATPIAGRVTDLIAALARIHADRGIDATAAVAPDLAVRCDPQDLDEMLGNLIDNGWRWAAARLEVSAARTGAMVRIVVADDGPGLPAEDLARAMEPGARLDESGEGHGFGLSITRELAELHGGRLVLENRVGGGLAAAIELPAG